jgi:hypothetical protein
MSFENRENTASMLVKAAVNIRYENDIDKDQLRSVLAMHNGQNPK